MQADGAGSALEPSASLYARQAVDDFLVAATAERERLRQTIVDAKARADRARAAVGIHRVMVSMLLETQLDLAAQRDAADVEAQNIVTRAEEEARAIVQAAREELERRRLQQLGAPAPAGQPVPLTEPANDFESLAAFEPMDTRAEWTTPASADPVVDLTRMEHEEHEQERWLPPSNSFGSMTFVRTGMPETRNDDQYFAYLRAALADDQPLGPRLD